MPFVLLVAGAADAQTVPQGSSGIVESTDGTQAGLLVGCESCVHCPEHPYHCPFWNWTRTNLTIHSNVSVRHNGSYFDIPVALALNTSAEVVLNLSQSGIDAGTTHNVSVGVLAFLGGAWTGNTTQNVTLDAGGTSVAFPFQVAPVWAADDHLFLPYVLAEGGETAGSYAAVKVASVAEPPETPALPLLLLIGVVCALALARGRAKAF